MPHRRKPSSDGRKEDSTATGKTEFHLAPLTTLDPRRIVPECASSEEDERFAEFMLTLSLFFNDVKGILLMFAPVSKEASPPPGEVSAQAGQWVGLDMQRHRLIASLLHELFGILVAFEREATGTRMEVVLKRVHPRPRSNWRALIGRLPKNANADTKRFASRLAQIRANLTFHYDQPKRLVQGFRRHFFEMPGHPSHDHAFCSFGNTMEATRFYYADAAVEQALWIAHGKDDSAAFLKELTEVVGQANEAIWAVLVAYLARARVSARASSK